MRKYLINPYKTYYKANMHCHTTNSDGNFTPEEIKKLYMDKGYSIVAYSDHDVIVDNSHLTDDNFIALTSTEYSINESGDDHHKNKVVHLNLFAKDPHNTFHVACSWNNIYGGKDHKFAKDIKLDGYERVYTIESLNETIKRANDAGFLVQYNHPHWSLNTREDYINLKGLWSLEILNYLTEIETGAEYCPYIYDDMLNSGMKLFCTMGDDNHNFSKSTVGSFGGYTLIGCEKLTYGNVIKAMECGDFYCSSGPVIKSLYIEDGKIFLECSEAQNIIITCKDRRYRNHFGENLTKAEFDIKSGDSHFRITVVDKYGNKAHTNVYYTKELGL